MPSLYSFLPPQHERSSWHHIRMSWSSALTLQWENHCAHAPVLPWFVHISTVIHAGTPNTMKALNPLVPLPIPLWHLCHIESLTEGEKQACNTLQGLFDTLVTKFRPQFNETIKLLQFRKLCMSKGESAEEWMGRLHMAVVECNYREVDQQLKEQFIHGLNDKVLLEEVIRKLTTRKNDEQTTSEGVLVWVKRVEVQRAQAAILSDITESCKFDKIKMAQRSKGSQDKQMPCTTSNRQPCRYCSGIHMSWQCPVYGETCIRCRKTGHFRKVCRSKGDCVVHGVEVKMVQDSQHEEIETVSINWVQLNKNWLVITAHLERYAGKNCVEIPYKIDMGSKSNILLLYIFKKLFKNITGEQLTKIHKNTSGYAHTTEQT